MIRKLEKIRIRDQRVESETRGSNQRPGSESETRKAESETRCQNHPPQDQRPDRAESETRQGRIRDQAGLNQRPDRVAAETKGLSRESKGFIVVTTGLFAKTMPASWVWKGFV